MDKKSFETVLDEIRKCILMEHRIKAIENVHGYFSSEQVIELLRYFSWAEPQLKAVKALQHKMVAVHATQMASILNCFTFSKDRLIALELIAYNILDAHNYRPIEELFRVSLPEKKRCRRILEQVSKVGCKAPHAMISSCGMIPGNPYPKGKPSRLNGVFPGVPAKKEGEESTSEGKGIAARILGPSKPAPSTYNPHKPVPYPIPPCRPCATIAPKKEDLLNQLKLLQSQTFSLPSSQISHLSAAASNSVAFSSPGSNPSAPSTPVAAAPAPSPAKPTNHSSAPATPSLSGLGLVTPGFPSQVSSASASPQRSSTPASSVIKSLPLSAVSAHSAPSTPAPSFYSNHSMPPTRLGSSTPVPTVIKTHTSSETPSISSALTSPFTSVSLSFPGLPLSSAPLATTTGITMPNSLSAPIPHAFSGLPLSSVPLATASGIAMPNSSSATIPPAFTGLPLSLSLAPQGAATPSSSAVTAPSPVTTSGTLGLPSSLVAIYKAFLEDDVAQLSTSVSMPSVSSGLPPSTTSTQHASHTSAPSVIKSYTPSATPTPQGSSTSVLSAFTGLPLSSASVGTPTPPEIPAQSSLVAPMSTAATQAPSLFHTPSPLASSIQHSSSTPILTGTPVFVKTEPSSPSAFKGPTHSTVPLGMSVSDALCFSQVLAQSASSGQVNLSNPASSVLLGLSSLGASLNTSAALASCTPAPHGSASLSSVFSGLAAFASLASNSALAGSPGLPPSATPSDTPLATPAAATSSATPTPLVSSTPAVFPILTSQVTPSPSPFPLGLSTPIPSILSSLTSSVTQGALGSSSPSFPGFPASSTPSVTSTASPFAALQASSTAVAATVAPLPTMAVAAATAAAAAPSPAPVLPGFASAFSSNFNSALVAQAGLTAGLQPTGSTAFPSLLSFPGISGFSQNVSQSSLPGLQHAAAAQSALLQTASALESLQAQSNGFASFPSAPGATYSLQSGLNPQMGWQ